MTKMQLRRQNEDERNIPSAGYEWRAAATTNQRALRVRVQSLIAISPPALGALGNTIARVPSFRVFRKSLTLTLRSLLINSISLWRWLSGHREMVLTKMTTTKRRVRVKNKILSHPNKEDLVNLSLQWTATNLLHLAGYQIKPSLRITKSYRPPRAVAIGRNLLGTTLTN
jgi:hypothetical protein